MLIILGIICILAGIFIVGLLANKFYDTENAIIAALLLIECFVIGGIALLGGTCLIINYFK